MPIIERKYKLYLNKFQSLILNQMFINSEKLYKIFLEKGVINNSEKLLSQYTIKSLYNNACISKKNAKNNKFKIHTISISIKDIEIRKNKIYLKNVGYIKVKPEIRKEKMLLCKIMKSKTNKFYMLFSVKIDNIYINKTNKAIGIDLGLMDFCVFSNGAKIKNPKYYFKVENKIKKLQNIRSKKKYMSKEYCKISKSINKIYEKISNKENDFLHKLSKNIIFNYDIICLESLDIKGLMTSSKYKKSINYVCWFKFIKMLKYKSNIYNKKLVFIDKYYKSTQICSNCGNLNNIHSLNIREYQCIHCEKKLDRDVNAAKNILREGLKRINIKIK